MNERSAIKIEGTSKGVPLNDLGRKGLIKCSVLDLKAVLVIARRGNHYPATVNFVSNRFSIFGKNNSF